MPWKMAQFICSLPCFSSLFSSLIYRIFRPQASTVLEKSKATDKAQKKEKKEKKDKKKGKKVSLNFVVENPFFFIMVWFDQQDQVSWLVYDAQVQAF